MTWVRASLSALVLSALALGLPSGAAACSFPGNPLTFEAAVQQSAGLVLADVTGVHFDGATLTIEVRSVLSGLDRPASLRIGPARDPLPDGMVSTCPLSLGLRVGDRVILGLPMNLETAGPGGVFVWRVLDDGSLRPNGDPLTQRVLDAPKTLDAFLTAIGAEPRSPDPIPSGEAQAAAVGRNDAADESPAPPWWLALAGALAVVGGLGAFLISSPFRKPPDTRP